MENDMVKPKLDDATKLKQLLNAVQIAVDTFEGKVEGVQFGEGGKIAALRYLKQTASRVSRE